MAHNIRLIATGNRYITKAGNDSNDGNSPDTPTISVLQVNLRVQGGPSGAPGAGYRTVLGTGQYVADALIPGQYPTLAIEADGTVILQPSLAQGVGSWTAYTPGNGGYYMHFTGIIFRLYGKLSFISGGDRILSRRFTRCQLLFSSRAAENLAFPSDVMSYGGVYNVTALDSIFYRAQMATGAPAIDLATRCLFIDCGDVNVTDAQYCSFGPTSVIHIGNTFLNTGAVDRSGIIQHCNIRGAIVSATGTIYPNLAAAQAAGVVDNTNFSSLEGFNNAAALDFTLRFNSANLAAAVGPAHLRYALTWFVRSTAGAGNPASTVNTYLENSADASRVDFYSLAGFSLSQAGSLYVTENLSGNFEAVYFTGVLQFATTAQELQSLPLITGLNIDSSTPVSESSFDSNNPEVLNNNVPDATNWASGQAGRNPNRLTIKARFSTRQAPRGNVDTDWFPSDGTLIELEINSKPLWNQATGRGNGDPLFDPNTAQVIRATAMQIQYTARNNYFSR